MGNFPDVQQGETLSLKCPECGFVTFPGLDRCKKCGHDFADLRSQSKGIESLFQQPHPEANAPTASASKTGLDQTEMAEHEASELDIELKPENASAEIAKTKEDQPTAPPPDFQTAHEWQAELAERVKEFRQRRAKLRSAKDDDRDNLDLDFGPSSPAQPESRPNIIEFPTSEELERQAKPAPAARPTPRRTGLENFGSGSQPERSKVKPPLGPKAPSPSESAPLEIELGSSQGNSTAGIRAGGSSGVPSASMSTRFFAGLIDGLVLLFGAAAYSLIFWRIAGSFSFRPLDMVVAGVTGIFFILLYFAGCTVLASATPGLIWNGLEVATFEGNPLALSDCLWRAFGYLVSISALMLGFAWAAVDADGLTWHDRMSRTFIVPAIHQ